MSDIHAGPHVLCECCKKPTFLRSASISAEPKGQLVVSKKFLHRILHELSGRLYEPWSYGHRRTRASLRCKRCYSHRHDGLYWFYTGTSYIGGFCKHCLQRSISESLGHEEDGASGDIPLLYIQMNKRVSDLIKAYKEAYDKKVAAHAEACRVEVSTQEIQTEMQLF